MPFKNICIYGDFLKILTYLCGVGEQEEINHRTYIFIRHSHGQEQQGSKDMGGREGPGKRRVKGEKGDVSVILSTTKGVF